MNFRCLTVALVLAISVGCSDGDPVVHLTTAEVTRDCASQESLAPQVGRHSQGQLSIKGVDRTLVAAEHRLLRIAYRRHRSSELWVDSYMDISRSDYRRETGKCPWPSTGR